MTNRTIAAMFDRYEDAADAVRRLEGAGIAHGDISIVSNDASHSKYHDADIGDPDHVSGTGAGASIGTLLGGGAGLLAGLGMLAIPGLGPVVAAGWLASTLVGAGIGAAAGGLTGSLTDVGVSHEDADAYAEGVRRGGTLVTVKADESLTSQVTGILDRNGTIDLDERSQSWREDGWSGASTDASGLSTQTLATPKPSLNPTSSEPFIATPIAEAVDDGRLPRVSRVRIYDQRP